MVLLFLFPFVTGAENKYVRFPFLGWWWGNVGRMELGEGDTLKETGRISAGLGLPL